MLIRELKNEAKDALKGNLINVTWPLAIILIFNYLLVFGFDVLVKDVLQFSTVLTLISTIIFYGLISILSSILQLGIIKRIVKISRKEESNFFKDTFSMESIKESLGILWGFVKKYAIWVVLLIVPITLSAMFLSMVILGVLNNSFLEMLEILIYLSYISYIVAIIMIVVISYRYMLVYYLRYDYPDKPTKELFENSRMMMRGNKAKACVVPITMIGWLILFLVAVLLISMGLEFIWASEVGTISTVPEWANILTYCIIYFLASMITSYINMTYYQLYMEQKPLEIYNDDYIKPETNAKKYIWILIGVFALIFLLYCYLVYLYMSSFGIDAMNL